MKLDRLNILGCPVLGVFGRASESYCLVAYQAKKKTCDKISEILQVPVHRIKVVDTNFVGLFLSGNSSGIVVPDIVNEKIELDVTVTKIKTKHTCLGNLILANDKGAILSPLLSEYSSEIRDTLDVDVSSGTIARLPIVGSLAVATNSGVLAHPEIKEDEKLLIGDILQVEVFTGTLNKGSPFVGSSILANTKGAVIGDLTRVPEVIKLEEALG